MTKRYMVYVERSVMTTERAAMIVIDEADLKKQFAKHELEVRQKKYVGKVERDGAGKMIQFPLNSDWDVK